MAFDPVAKGQLCHARRAAKNEVALNSKRMPHLTRHALDRIRVLTIVEALIACIEDYNNAYRYQQTFHPMLL